MALSQKHCIPCQVGAPKLTESQVAEFISQLTLQWQVTDNKKVSHQFKFEDFNAAIKFINQVAVVAQKENHHPNIHLTNWNKVTIELFTHKIDGLHANDFILASKIESLLGTLPAQTGNN